jgi:hypothetical protein
MAKRGRKNDTTDGIIRPSTIGSQTVLNAAFRAFEVRTLSKGATTTAHDPDELAFITLHVVLFGLVTSPELKASFLGRGNRLPRGVLRKIITETLAFYEDERDVEISGDERLNGLRQADMILDEVFQVGNRKSTGVANAMEFVKLTIATIAYRHWYRPRIEAGPPENGKRQRRPLRTVHLSAILYSLQSSGTEIGNEADLVCANDERRSIDARIDMLRAGLSDIEWAVFEAYTIDDDATLELLAAREWLDGTKLSVKQIRRILEEGRRKLERFLGPQYAHTQANN